MGEGGRSHSVLVKPVHTGPGLDREQYKEEEPQACRSVLLTWNPMDRH